MAHFVLVHGASHGGWCWRHVVPRLRAAGHEAIAVDLPGHAVGDAPRDDVTLAEYRAAVLSEVAPSCILVGHSLGGLSITLAGAARPEDVRAMVYVAALVPDPGERFVDIRKNAISPVIDTVTRREGGLSVPIPETAADVFYSGCSAADRDFALSRISPQPVSVMTEALEFTPADLPRHYVLCSEDLVVLPEYQRRITRGWPGDRVHELNTGHSPFFSDPDGLATVLDAIAEGQE